MIKSFILVSLRNIRKHKLISSISFFSLFISFSLALSIFSFVNNEKSFDQNIPDNKHKFRLTYDIYGKDGRNVHAATSPAPYGPFFKNQVPEIEDFVRVYMERNALLTHAGGTSLKSDDVALTDNGILNYFGINLLRGSNELVGNNSLMISNSMAEKLFNIEPQLGQVIRLNGQHEFTVVGVYEDFPINSSLAPDIILPIDFLQVLRPHYYREGENWGGYAFYTYFQLSNGSQKDLVLEKFEASYYERFEIDREDPPSEYAGFDLMNVSDIHLHSDLEREMHPTMSISKIRLLELLSIAILLIGWVNFMNIQASKAPERLKEIAIRKTLGAHRMRLVLLLFFEFIMLNTFSIILSVLIWQYGISHQLQDLISINGDSILLNPMNIIVLITGIVLSSIYPAAIIVNQIFKGNPEAFKTKAPRIRNAMMMLQFSASIFLIIFTLVIYKQITYLNSQDPGIDTSKLLVVNGPMTGGEDDYSKAEYFSTKVEGISGVVKSTFSSLAPGINKGWQGNLPSWDGDNSKFQPVYLSNINQGFFETLDVETIAGILPSGPKRMDLPRLVLNENAVKGFNWSPEEAIGKKVGYTDTAIVSAVVHDFNTVGFQDELSPMVFIYDHFYHTGATNDYFISRVSTKDIAEQIAEIERTFSEVYPNDPFEFHFSDYLFELQYESEFDFMRLFILFSLCSIVIALMGLMGVTLYGVIRKQKEICVRKVLGATLFNLLRNICVSYSKIFLLSSIITIPVAFWFSKQWLSDFAYRIEMNALIFILPTLFIMIFAFLAITLSSLKTINQNPANFLSRED